MPSSFRTELCAPSQPTTYRARRAASSPRRSSANVTTTRLASASASGPSSALAPASAGVSGGCVRPTTSRPSSTRTPYPASRARRISSSRHWATSHARSYAASGDGAEPAHGSARATGARSRYLSIGNGAEPAASTASATPRSSRISSDRGLGPLAREVRGGAGDRSTIRTAIPRRARSQASTSPVGPAPTTSTSVTSVLVTVPAPLSASMALPRSRSPGVRTEPGKRNRVRKATR